MSNRLDQGAMGGIYRALETLTGRHRLDCALDIFTKIGAAPDASQTLAQPESGPSGTHP
jgi:hypothetical protein